MALLEEGLAAHENHAAYIRDDEVLKNRGVGCEMPVSSEKRRPSFEWHLQNVAVVVELDELILNFEHSYYMSC